MDGRRRRKRRLILIGLGLCAIGFSCTFQIPSDPPVWVVNLIIPLINKAYTVREMIEDGEIDELIIDEPNEQIILEYSDDADVDFASLLEIDIPSSNKWYPADQDTPDSVAVSGAGIVVSQEAVIDSGWMHVTVENPNAYPLHVVFDIIDLWYPEGGTFASDWNVNAFGQESRSFRVDDHVLRMAEHNGVNYLRYWIGGNGNAGDTFRVFYWFGDVSFRSITGTFNQVEASFQDVEIESPVPDELKEFRIETAMLTMRFTAGIQLPLDIRFEISGQDFSGTPAPPITIDTTLTAWDGVGAPPEYTFTRDVADFVNSMPDLILFEGTASVGEGGTEATISIDDPISGEFEITAPLIVTLPEYTSEMDVDTLELDEDTREVVRDNVVEMSIDADIQNYLPISTTATLFFSGTLGDSTLYEFPDFTVGPVVLAPATITGDPGVVTAPGVSQWNEVLTKENEIALFEEEIVYWGVRFEFNGTAGQMAKIRPSDYVHLRAHARVRARTKIPEDENGGGGGL